MGLDDFPRVPLLFGPSPVHPLPRLSAALGGGVEIWAKREDCNSGIAFGGNKVRKLEYLVADALAQGCDTLVSIGGVQSNHTRQVTGVACHLGPTIRSVVSGSPTGPVRWPPRARLGVFFDHVIVCTVTGSTHAGMIAGFALERRRDRRVIGIDASKTIERTVAQVTRIANDTADRIGVGRALGDDEITVLDGYAGPAYGIPDESTIEAIHLAARTEGMLTDPVYEGKSMAGLIDMVRSGAIPQGSRVLYAHLGGQPALSAYAGAPGLGSADSADQQ